MSASEIDCQVCQHRPGCVLNPDTCGKYEYGRQIINEEGRVIWEAYSFTPSVVPLSWRNGGDA